MSSNSKKKKMSLFEAMHRAHPAVPPPPPPRVEQESGPSWWERRAQRRAAERAERAEREVRRETELAAAAADAAARELSQMQSMPEPVEGDSPSRGMRFENGRLNLSLGALGCMMAAACVCVAVLASYSAGKRAGSAGPGERSPALAARPGSPLGGGKDVGNPPKTSVEQRVADLDLSALMQAPPSRRTKNQPQTGTPAPAAQPIPAVANPPQKAASGPERKPLQYLQIETFRRPRGGDVKAVLTELEDVRRFLAARNIETRTVETEGEILLLSARGFESTKERAAIDFQRQVEHHGRAYAKSGGRYEFKGCFYRSENALPDKNARKR